MTRYAYILTITGAPVTGGPLRSFTKSDTVLLKSSSTRHGTMLLLLDKAAEQFGLVPRTTVVNFFSLEKDDL